MEYVTLKNSNYLEEKDFEAFQQIMKLINKPIYNDKFKYNINEIPFFIYDNSNGTSSLLFIDFEK